MAYQALQKIAEFYRIDTELKELPATDRLTPVSYTHLTSEMPIRDFWNLVGRAGRAGQNDVGMIGITIGARNDNQMCIRDSSYTYRLSFN